MSKYTAQAHEERRTSIQSIRDILMVSHGMINSNLPVAKTIGRLSAMMPSKKREFAAINFEVDYLLQDKVIALVSEGLKAEWTSHCESLKG